MSEAVDLKKIGIALNSVVADRKSIDKTVAEIEKSLDDAAGDVDDIELAENRLRSLEKVIAKAIVKAQGVMGLLREAETDEAFVAPRERRWCRSSISGRSSSRPSPRSSARSRSWRSGRSRIVRRPAT